MALNANHISKLRRIVTLAEKLISEAAVDGRRTTGAGKPNGFGKRRRRTGQELARFRKMLKAARKNGVPVAEIARKHGVSSAYIYMLR